MSIVQPENRFINEEDGSYFDVIKNSNGEVTNLKLVCSNGTTTFTKDDLEFMLSHFHKSEEEKWMSNQLLKYYS